MAINIGSRSTAFRSRYLVRVADGLYVMQDGSGNLSVVFFGDRVTTRYRRIPHRIQQTGIRPATGGPDAAISFNWAYTAILIKLFAGAGSGAHARSADIIVFTGICACRYLYP